MIPGKAKEQRKVSNLHYEGLEKELIRSKPGSDYKTGSADAIVYVGGGKYWPGIVAGIQLLRSTGCRIPVEIWHRTCERVYPEDLKGLNAELINASTVARSFGHPNLDTLRNGGWVAKLIALYYTSAKKVLFLDADAYCVNNPDPLFKLLDRHEFLYWRDLTSQCKSIKWGAVYPQGYSNNVPPIQGGQLFIDREKAWKLIHTAFYLCINSDYYFNHIYGDQDSWRVGIAAGVSDNWKMIEKADWQGVAFVCKYDDTDYIVHRCQSKMFEPKYIPNRRVKYTNPQYHLPREIEIFNLFAGVVNKRTVESSEVFQEIYSKKLWGDNASGAGSREKEARPYIDRINSLIRSRGYTSAIDVGCGDGFVGSLIDVRNYLGVDCCERLIANNQKKYPKLSYIPLDIYKDYDIIPSGDILLCKDVLHHWPNEWVVNWLGKLIESKRWKMVALCIDRQQREDFQNCHLGGYRALSWSMYPLNVFPLTLEMEFLHKSILTIEL